MKPFVTEPGVRIPFLRPNPPTLSDEVSGLRQIEASGIFSNFGPCESQFEEDALSIFFGNSGAVVPICNATLGLMLAMKAVGRTPDGVRNRLALMPSFCFAATAQAALWAGYQPHFYDVDPHTWLPAETSEGDIIKVRADEIGLVVPYATFGAALDFRRYDGYADDFGIPCVIDAAASLGTRNLDGTGYGTGCRWPIVYSMHATKTFATSEGGLIYTTNPDLASNLRDMANFGFGSERTATMPGLNAKLSEVAAFIARKRLIGFDAIVEAREALVERYRSNLPDFEFQMPTGSRHAHQFTGLLVPKDFPTDRDQLIDALKRRGIGSAKYFSPHLRDHPYFAKTCSHAPTPVTDELSERIICLPLSDDMQAAQVDEVSMAVLAAATP